MVIKYKREDFLKMLDDFSKMCKEKHYTKIDYSTWKSMINGIKNTEYVYIDDSEYPRLRVGDEKGCINWFERYVISADDYFSNKNKSKWHMIIRTGDNSFCDFLLKFGAKYSYAKHKSKDDMTKTNFINEANLATSAISSHSYADSKVCSYDLATENDYYYSSTTDWAPTTTTTTLKINTICDGADNIQLTVDRKADIEVVEALRKEVNDIKDKIEEKEKNNMFKFDFGSCEGNTKIAMSMYGLALRNGTGTWVSYDANSHSVMDVDILNSQSMNKYMYRMPVAIKDVAVGDTIIHNGYPMFVSEITNEGKIVVVDVANGEEKIIMPTKNIFGFNFYTKIVSLFDGCFDAVSNENPFGNMFPFLLMENNNNITDVMMMMMLSGNKNNINFNNPLMLAILMDSDNKNFKDVIPFMLMMGNNR